MTETDPITKVCIMFYDDVENRDAYRSYRGMATSSGGVEFALPPKVGDLFFPAIFGAAHGAQALVTNVSHGPRFNGVGDAPMAMVTVAHPYDKELIDHLGRSGNWEMSMNIGS